MAIERFYKSLIAKKETNTTDGRGGSTLAYSDVAFNGLITYASSAEVDYYNKIGVDAQYTMYYELSADVNYKDLVSDGTNIYQVQTDARNTVNRNHHLVHGLKKVINT